MPILTPNEAQARLQRLPQWKLVEGEIVLESTFADFVSAMDFVNAVAEKAEMAGHHPDIDIRYNRVRLALISHDAGGLTPRDFELAEAINALS
ncbi:4a-hydroxytetrahydrobiopterin dehydratase [Silvibacterium bohemicum]|uniref:Putative pterin-4-alpha-carbinolamine dehydratase n=1 Tax=Silvibacterium bohemicum TaxID=1577686 RepID=A0A841JVK9_9BACT|nr:4a-hydroxytetrahydrobiopterin dehydratase [Silvibacterium bohemicum]MBB6145386.1 4a-hydroxytetrahydrobiopterin dehydratase [Silvibacterium bohemicum]